MHSRRLANSQFGLPFLADAITMCYSTITWYLIHASHVVCSPGLTAPAWNAENRTGTRVARVRWSGCPVLYGLDAHPSPQSFAFRGFAAPASCAFGFVLGVRARSAATPLRGLTCATSRSGSGFAFALNRLTASPSARPPPVVGARTGVAALRSAHGLRPR